MTTPLSAFEQKILAELELQLLDVDTPPVDTAAEPPAQESGRYWFRLHALTGALAALAGGVFLALGVALPSIAVGSAGFVLMGAGVYFATLPAGVPRRKRTKNPEGSAAADATPGAGKMADTGRSSVGGRFRDVAWWGLLLWL